MDMVGMLAMGFFLPLVLVLTNVKMGELRRMALAERRRMGWFARLGCALGAVIGGLGVGMLVVYGVMFGPSHLTGDFIGLPWLTALPALALGLWLMARTTQWLTRILLARMSVPAQ